MTMDNNSSMCKNFVSKQKSSTVAEISKQDTHLYTRVIYAKKVITEDSIYTCIIYTIISFYESFHLIVLLETPLENQHERDSAVSLTSNHDWMT